MAVFEKTIVAGIGVQAEAIGQVPIYIEIEAEIGLSGFGEYGYIPRTELTNVIWADAMEKNRDNPEKAAEYLQAKNSLWELKIVSAQKKILQIEKLSLQERAGEIANLSEYGHEVQLWCADYTLDLSGDIGTIEVPGEQTARNIQPGYEGNAVYDAERDGQMLPAIVNTPAGVFWNLAMLPGWQKWKPTFRYGTITAIDHVADTCSLNLEAATSSQQKINVNQETTLSGVPIEYMYCHSSVFEVDDVVLIKFTGQDFATPKVIGFKSHPKRCTQWVMFKCYVAGQPPRYVVWDAHENGFADLSNWGGPAVAGDYPCEAADLAAWLATTSQASTSQCFDTVRAAGEGTYTHISGQPPPDYSQGTSDNSGCEPLEYERTRTYIGELPWDIEMDAFYPAFMYSDPWPPYWDWNDWAWPAKMDKSYILEVADGLTARGDRSCYRMQMEVTFRGYGMDPVANPSTMVSSTYDMISTRYTPLGAMDPTIYDKTGIGVGGSVQAYPSRDLKDLDWFYPSLASCTKYSDVVMVQCYTAQIAQRYRTAEYHGSEVVWDGDQAFFTAAQIAIDYNADDITSVNPKNQSRIAALEAKVVEAMDEAADLAGPEKCIDYMDVTIRE